MPSPSPPHILPTRLIVQGLLVVVMLLGVASSARLGGQASLVAAVLAEPSVKPATVFEFDADFNADLDDPSIPKTPEGALSPILDAASGRLQSTFAAWEASESMLYPDIVNPETGDWRTDDLSSNGAAGLLASSLWNMYDLTGSEAWLTRAQMATKPLLHSAADSYLGQSLGTLLYPAIRYAYEAEEDNLQKQAYLTAALQAANTISKLYVRINGVLKVRPTSDIASEARAAGAAAISPLAVFSSVEGSASAAALLAWAAGLPGGKAAWREMAITNARRIAAHHVREDGNVLQQAYKKEACAIVGQSAVAGSVSGQQLTGPTSGNWLCPPGLKRPPDPWHFALRNSNDATPLVGSVRGTLVYKATSATAEPVELSAIIPRATQQLDFGSSLASSSSTAASAISALIGTLAGIKVTATEQISSGKALDAWLSSIAGHETSQALRQALVTITLAEAAQLTTSSTDRDLLLGAAQAAAAPLVDSAAEEVSIVSSEPAAAAAAAAALAELAAATSMPAKRAAYAMTARHIISTLAAHRLVADSAVEAAASSSSPLVTLSTAGRWLSSFLPATEEATDFSIPAASHRDIRLLRWFDVVGGTEPSAAAAARAAETAAAPRQPVSVLVGVDGVSGSMLADAMLLRAVLRLISLAATEQ